MLVEWPDHVPHPATHRRLSLTSCPGVCRLYLDVGWFQEETAVLLQGIQQWQGKDAAEADGEEPGLLVHIHGWPQGTVGRVRDPEGLGPGRQRSGLRHPLVSLSDRADRTAFCFSQGFLYTSTSPVYYWSVNPSTCRLRAVESAVPAARYLQGSLTHPRTTLLNSPLSANLSQPQIMPWALAKHQACRTTPRLSTRPAVNQPLSRSAGAPTLLCLARMSHSSQSHFLLQSLPAPVPALCVVCIPFPGSCLENGGVCYWLPAGS